MSPMLSWTLLDILAWAVGVKAVHDLRAQFDPRAKTWFLLDWGVRSCLAMEVAMLGVGTGLGGFGLVSVLTGVASALFLLLGFRSLRNDLCLGEPMLLGRRGWGHVFGWAALLGAAVCLLAWWAAPERSRFWPVLSIPPREPSGSSPRPGWLCACQRPSVPLGPRGSSSPRSSP